MKNLLSDREFEAYVAGLFDRKDNMNVIERGNKNVYDIRFHIDSADKEWLEMLRDITDIGTVHKKRNIYSWSIQSRDDAKELIHMIYPYSFRYKDRLSKALEYLQTGDNDIARNLR